MIYHTLGRSGLEVSAISLGTGGPSRIGQRTHADEARSHEVVQRALDLGINFLDTAAAYGQSEEILGRALKGIDRGRYYLATKFTPDPGEQGKLVDGEAVVASCERSLQRLQTDVIDLFQFHGLVPDNYHEAVERLYPTVQRLQQQGKVRFIGVTEYFYRDPGHEMLKAALRDDLWDALMVKYGILNMTAEREVLPQARAQNVGVINMSTVRVKLTRPEKLAEIITRWKDQGLLAADSLPSEAPLDFLVHDGVRSIVDAGYRFGASDDAVSTVLIGTGNVEHLEANVASVLGTPLPAEDLHRLRQLFGGIVQSEEPSPGS
ncbi:MAG: aldo/keto reductase [Pirellulaceae bacterium]